MSDPKYYLQEKPNKLEWPRNLELILDRFLSQYGANRVKRACRDWVAWVEHQEEHKLWDVFR